MEAIVSHSNEFGAMNWDSNTVVAANGFLKMYTSFSFIVSFIAAMNAMAIIKPISIKLQSKYYDIVKAYELINLRGCDEMLHAWYVQAEDLAKDLNVTPQVPRTAGRQCHRENVEHNSVEEYYRRCIILPLIDSFIQQMNDRFSNTQILDLVPSIICTHSAISLDEVTSFYSDDLANPAMVPTEVWRWRAKWLDEESRPPTLQKALKECDQNYFPNIYILLRIACTLPVTSCENERAHSTLNNLKTSLRNSMGQERMSSLALMHIHYNKIVNLDDVVDRFKLKCNRRIKL